MTVRRGWVRSLMAALLSTGAVTAIGPVARAGAVSGSVAVRAFSVAGILDSVTAISPRNAWAVGSLDAGGTMILHWGGARWRLEPTLIAGGGLLTGVAAASGGRPWAVGATQTVNSRTLIMR